MTKTMEHILKKKQPKELQSYGCLEFFNSHFQVLLKNTVIITIDTAKKDSIVERVNITLKMIWNSS